MSALMYLAADIPFLEVKNPHEQTISIQEALERGIEVPDWLLQDEKADRNDPKMLLYTDRYQIHSENGTFEDLAYDDDLPNGKVCRYFDKEGILRQRAVESLHKRACGADHPLHPGNADTYTAGRDLEHLDGSHLSASAYTKGTHSGRRT